MGMDSVSGAARGNHSLHFTFLRQRIIRGDGRSHSIVANLTSSLQETTVVRLEVLEIEKRDRPAASTTAELRMSEPPPGILSMVDGRLARGAGLTRVRLDGDSALAWP